uniref:Uncharacterized protein n=1 Tax=Candidatus Kentrum sp. TC TaxID=2126339 RepID=A0A450Z681_9GAMM|nr:MAG: hypothetical protein BECKTC1821D_GA0114238_107411 [Candidatus Kentron sp. TC]VFK55692.1 MAG: hypothetical protein BECKTC1821F_GA0114240_100784 [Candidatus Kentron sp. TC]
MGYSGEWVQRNLGKFSIGARKELRPGIIQPRSMIWPVLPSFRVSGGPWPQVDAGFSTYLAHPITDSEEAYTTRHWGPVIRI